MAEYFDRLETCNPQEREKQLFSMLPSFLKEIMAKIPGWKDRLQDINPDTINSRQALAKLPVLRKQELMEAQKANPPFGGFADRDLVKGTRIFMSPGPVWEPQPPGIDPWQTSRAMFAAGIRAGDLVQNCFSHHMTPGGMFMDEGARALGANVFPAGTGNSEMQVEAAAMIRPTAYAGTPDFLKIILDKAAEMDKDLSSITRAIVSGGALFPSLREEYARRGVMVMQAFATADLGIIAYETALNGSILPGMVCSENMIFEIVRPGSDEPVPDGEVGELVVTSFNRAYPFIRLGTGDLSAILDEPSPCGRTNVRIRGWMGRADQRTKVKGMFIDPKQVDRLTKSVKGIKKAQLVVTRAGDRDEMTLKVIAADGAKLDTQKLAAELAIITKIKGEVELVSDLANDGKVIDDQRDYSR